MSVIELSTLSVGYVAKQLHVNDGKEHEEDASEENDDQQLCAVTNDLEEEVSDGFVSSQKSG